jgi:hypothetical protein
LLLLCVLFLPLLLLLFLTSPPREMIHRPLQGRQQALRVPPCPNCCFSNDLINFLVGVRR